MIYLYLTPFFPSSADWRGGYFYDYAAALQRTGRYRVCVFTFGDGPDYTFDGIEVHRLRRSPARLRAYFPSLLRATDERIFRRKLDSLGIAPRDVAVCHVNEASELSIYALLLKRLHPAVFTRTTHHFVCDWWKTSIGRFAYVPLLSELKYAHIRRLGAGLDEHVFVSEAAKRGFGRYSTGLTVDDTADVRRRLWTGRWLAPMTFRSARVQYNGYDSSRFRPAPVAHEGFVIGCVANFIPGKRQIDLVRALPRILEKVPSARIRFLGSGETLEPCRREAARLGVERRVSFEREVPHGEMPRFYNALDLFVLPSVNEGFCCALVEAAACGVPVMFTELISMNEVLTEPSRRALAFRPFDPEDLADKALALHAHPVRPEYTVDLDIDRLVARQSGDGHGGEMVEYAERGI